MEDADAVTETQLANKVTKAIRDRGHWCMKVAGGPHQQPGIPDILACVRGALVAIELKVGRNKPTPLQIATLGDMSEAGAVAGVAYTLDEAMDLIDRAT